MINKQLLRAIWKHIHHNKIKYDYLRYARPNKKAYRFKDSNGDDIYKGTPCCIAGIAIYLTLDKNEVMDDQGYVYNTVSGKVVETPRNRAVKVLGLADTGLEWLISDLPNRFWPEPYASELMFLVRISPDIPDRSFAICNANIALDCLSKIIRGKIS